jgi:hypothetical protein
MARDVALESAKRLWIWRRHVPSSTDRETLNLYGTR